jgi:hypothetical protein
MATNNGISSKNETLVINIIEIKRFQELK